MSVKIKIKKNPEGQLALLERENEELHNSRDELEAKLASIQGVIAGDVEIIEDDEDDGDDE